MPEMSGHNHNIDFRLSLDNTQIIKGIAICLMLWHHLFYQHSELSAYGLTVQYGKVYSKPIINKKN
jgi:hypothetical protein